MSMVAKILIVLNLILSVAVMGAAGAYLQSAENWRKKHDTATKTLGDENAALNDRLVKTQANYDEATRAKSAAEQARTQFETQAKTHSENNALLQNKFNDLNASNQSQAANLKDLAANLDTARQANDKLQGEKRQAEEDRRAALDAQAKAETEQKRLSNEIENLTASLDAAAKAQFALKESLDATKTRLDLYVSKYPAPGAPTAMVKGQVLAADASSDIYLISVGEKDGLKVADELTVSRGDQFVAVVVVDKVFPDKASVTVKRMGSSPLKKSDIKAGDKVGSSIL
jgi:predicted RNase H-like nuclease (RuvC/YqgF family)